MSARRFTVGVRRFVSEFFKMATIADALITALQHQQAGRWQPAEQIYRQILAINPQHVDALHLLGVLAYQVGNHAAGVELMEQAIDLNGTDATIHNNLGNAYKELRRFDKAEICCRRALELKPNF